MNTLTLNCNHCGAPLIVPDTVNYLTCQYCQCQLQVVREDSVAFTQELEELRGRTDELALHVRRLELQNEILMLDQKWEKDRQSLMIRGQDGLIEPTKSSGVMLIILGVIGGVMIGVQSVLAGAAVLMVTSVGGAYLLLAAAAFNKATRRYRGRRFRLELQLSQLSNHPV